ncbi:MAG: methyltransferase domain-containing protein [Verrucomicrobiaceae bacterium]|nr:methyltransferase domain-containing protein [Verrucomicrobiaceae bacterium]
MASSRLILRLARFLRVKPICHLVFKVRFWWFVHIKKRLRSCEDQVAVDGHQHNLRALKLARPSDRILWLIQPLTAIDKMMNNPDARVLAIGVRLETDLLYLAAYGFHPKNIRGMDLLSYSPWVDLGNMHQMSYADNSWDAVMLGWVLTYSTEPQKAADELVRVTKNGGIIAIGLTYYPEHVLEEYRKSQGSLMGTTGQIQTVADVLKLFESKVDRIYFNHDVADPARQGPTMVIFSVKK